MLSQQTHQKLPTSFVAKAHAVTLESSYLHSFEKPFTVGHTLNHRLLANMDARCAPCASMCSIMACLMFRASMPTTMSFSYPSKALQWCSSWLSESSDTIGCRNSFEVHACKDVDLCTTIEPSDREHRNDDTSNKKKSQFTKTCQCRRREHHREKLETYHILTTPLPH